MNSNLATLEMTISPDIEELFKKAPFFLEIEMLQGERNSLPDGRIGIKIEIHDEDKIEMVKEFMLKAISDSPNACKS